MKQIFCKTIAAALLLAAPAACDRSDEPAATGPGSDRVVLDFSSGNASRSLGTDTENRVDHIDVLIFDESNARKHYERLETGGSTAGGTETLTARRSSFTAGAKYWVYLIANADDTERERFASEGFDLTDLKSMKRTDRYLHLTGIPQETGSAYTLPQTFLMDGVAYSAADAEPAAAGPVVLNNGNLYDDTRLKVTLRRAAAKLVLKIKKGDRVSFTNYGDETGVITPGGAGGYYLRNMPYTTLIVGENEDVQVRTTQQSRTRYYIWEEQQITVTAYVYSHNWEKSSAIEREPRWILDIPMSYTPAPTDEVPAPETLYYPHSYYQIPVSGGTELRRNTCYTVDLTLNLPGGSDPAKPVALTDLTYSVEAWTEKTIPVGGEDDRPMFLTLNRTQMEMHNIDTDEKTLQFTSSSNVTAEVTRAYYNDKFGNEQEVGDDILDQIKLTPASALNGGIKIYSPVPENKAVRYIKIKVWNTDKIEREVLILQYPLEYITSVEGLYSYRKDFKSKASDNTEGVTTYVLLAGKEIIKNQEYSSEQVQDNSWICGCTYNSGWSYSSTGSNNSFFASKVATNFNETTGLCNINYYQWNRSYYNAGTNRRPRWVYSYNTSTQSIEGLNNHRMYKVRIMATSSTYTLGIPKINDNGVTDGGDDNAKLVSPSFMLASQLGAVQAIDSQDGAAEHCNQYVEVARDGTVYNDWRLPTAAEVKIIYEYQNNSDVMDVVLSGDRYWSASGLVGKPGVDRPTNKAIRCIRDAYDDPTAGTAVAPAAGDQ